MKKSIVALLLLLAVLVLVSPGIVGRLAERSLDQSLDVTVSATEDVTISSQGFRRGWFSSAGRHRIELHGDGVFRLPAELEQPDSDRVTALIVDTRIDHGLVPLSSMAREQGSLMPGLGSAVSTLGLEIDGDRVAELPGTIYSRIGLTGELQSNLVAEAGSASAYGRLFDWGDADIIVTSNPARGATAVAGTLHSLSMSAPGEVIRIRRLSVNAEQAPGPFGFAVGVADVEVDTLSIESAHNDFQVGPLALRSSLGTRGNAAEGEARLSLENFHSPLGSAAVELDARFAAADGRALGTLLRALRAARSRTDAIDTLMTPGPGLQALLAAGGELEITRLHLALPDGTLSSVLDITVADSSRPFSWPGVLLATEGTLKLRISEGMLALAETYAPSVRTAIGLGYLRSVGNHYETFIEISNGVLTINGAPMNLSSRRF